MPLNTHITNSIEELEQYANAWQQLAQKQYDSLAIMNQWDYFKAYITSHTIEDWYVILLTGTGQPDILLGIFPIRILKVNLPRQTTPIRVAVTLGTRYAAYLEYLIDPLQRQSIWDAALQVMQNTLKLDAFLIGPLHQTSLNYTHLLGTFKPEQYKHLSAHTNYQIETRYHSFAHYRRRSKSIKNAAYNQRRLSRQGSVDFYYSNTPEDVSQSLEFIHTHMQQKYAENMLYQDLPGLKNTLTKLSCATHESQTAVRVTVTDLRFEQQRIASELCLQYRNRWQFLLCAYDPAYSKYSPGKVLLHYLVKKAFTEQQHFCFGAGSYFYKSHWSNQRYSVNLLACFFNHRAKEAWSPYIEWKSLDPIYNQG